MSSSNHGEDKNNGETESKNILTSGESENRHLSSPTEMSIPSKQQHHVSSSVSDGNSPKALTCITAARPKSTQTSRFLSSATIGNVVDDDDDGALDELDIIKIAEARAKGESLGLSSSEINHQVATGTTNSERPSSRPTASTLRGGRRDPAEPHQRIGTALSANNNNGLEEGSNNVELAKFLEGRELAKVVEARERALTRQQQQQQHTETDGNSQQGQVMMSTDREHQYSTFAQGIVRPAPAQNTNSRPILKFLRKRAPAVNQQEQLEEEINTNGLCNEHMGQAETNQNPVINESQPGAYSGAPGLPLQRNQKPRFSLIGIVGTTPSFSPSSEMEISQESTEFQSTNMPGSQTGLMVANLVADLSQENLQLAEELQSNGNDIEEQKVERSKRAMLTASKWLLLGVVLVVAVVLAVVLGTRNKSATPAEEFVSSVPTTSAMPSVSPSSMPTETLLSARYEIKGLSESTAEAIGRPGSPQQQAYAWTFQHPEFDEMPNWRKQQLFALGTFYFSFENWPYDYQWMDYSNTECSWTTYLDSLQSQPEDSDYFPEGYSNYICTSSTVSSIGRLNPFASNCDEEGHFNFLKIRLLGVQGSIPPEIFLLTHLTIFDLREAGITGTIPSEIGMLSLLTNLNLHSTGISGAIPSGIGQTNLTGLYLNDNAVSGFLPSELGLLPFLKRMDLQSNNISGTLPADLANCTSLVRLDASNNSLANLSSEIGLLTTVEYLMLQDNQIEGTIPTEIGLLTSMYYLLLRDNTIKGVIPSEIGLLSNLVYLSLERNSISGAIPSTFDQSSVIQMDLQGNQLSYIPSEIGLLGNQAGQLDLSNNLILTLPSELFLLTSLSVLQLHGNRIEQLPNEIDQMTNLEPCYNFFDAWLSLSNNKLSSIPPEIGRLTNLRTFTFQRNQISSFPDVNWSSLPHLLSIQLSHNLLESTIPSELGLLEELVKLDLSNNALTGSIPPELGGIAESVERWNDTLGVAYDDRVGRADEFGIGERFIQPNLWSDPNGTWADLDNS
ncbi:LRR receptor-like serine threonine-protein kinase [Seminavis robusta]|uniref:LRR receptor-like serine threonine-protein kinase n=1 Tax=Seminavis robusta TaxID=568900 RepID=A0A9N8E145_9STRA|nr:LRR receptor-like serine threonine-protein kinase [Seminavis robusta]|eukprot:Sro544_g163670.1 LRR receptor-like serine threonine-protein kinase (1014) ;mRNA; r:31163-34506